MKVFAALATCWLAAALEVLLHTCWPAGLAGPDPFCMAAVLWASRQPGSFSLVCGGLLGLVSDLGGTSPLGPGVGLLSMAAWLAAGCLPAERATALAFTAGVAAASLRLVLALLAFLQQGVVLPGPALAANAVQSAAFTFALAWPVAWLLARRRRGVTQSL